MYGEKKTSWKCHICKPRNRSPNTLYQSVVFDDNNAKKKARADDEDDNGNEQAKKFKENMSLTFVNNKLCKVESDVSEFKSDLKEVKTTMVEMKDEIHTTLSSISTTLSTLVTQIKELSERDKQRENQINELIEKDKQKEQQINAMQSEINKLQQQQLSKNIEIKNIENKQMSDFEIVKTIATSVNVEIREGDIDRTYRIKKQNKIIVEFASLNKKAEFMSKIVRHRVDAKLINTENQCNKHNFIYLNDELTFNNRRLLWMAKMKAKENNWKYVWVNNGNICARKNENSPLFVIKNATDIESINNSM
ncbi:hypothetical protein CVS40_10971 [Lucilia cuprina]|nr:hypothetical protein CVS40_10971 [Lucilia cuprina]